MANFWDSLTGKNVTDAYDSQKTNVQNQNTGYTDTASKYTGNQGYTNSLQQQQKGQNQTAQNAAQQQQTSARNSGMSKAQQAAMGQNTTSNAFANNFNGQQSEAQNQGNNTVSQAQQNVQNTSNLQQLGVNQAQTQSQAQGTLQNGVANIAKILVPSDKRTKDAVDITDGLPSDEISAIEEGATDKKTTDVASQTTTDNNKNKGHPVQSQVGKVQGTQIGEAIQPGTGGQIGGVIGGAQGNLVSDERCKDKENLDKELVDSHKTKAKTISEYLQDIDTYLYKYKDSAQYQMPGMTDDDTHVGVMAQDLQKNPATQGTVEKDPKTGVLLVDTRQLSLTNTANIADLQRRLDAVERRLNDIDTNKIISEGE